MRILHLPVLAYGLEIREVIVGGAEEVCGKLGGKGCGDDVQ